MGSVAAADAHQSQWTESVLVIENVAAPLARSRIELAADAAFAGLENVVLDGAHLP